MHYRATTTTTTTTTTTFGVFEQMTYFLDINTVTWAELVFLMCYI